MTEQEAREEAIKLIYEWMPLVKFEIDLLIDRGEKFSDRYFSAKKRAAKRCAIIAQKRVITYCMRNDLEYQVKILKALEEL